MCRFCDIENGKYTYEYIDEPFYSSKDFFSIVSIGALVQGWTLIVPREHTFSMRTIYSNKDFISTVGAVAKKVEEKYGSVIAFEHGSYAEKSLTSCGTDHAHLHLVPFKSLLNEMDKSGLAFEKCKASDIAIRAGENEYLFYCELNRTWNNPEGYLHILDKPISQYFRKLIATALNISETFDYRAFPNIDNCILTRDKMSTEFIDCKFDSEGLNVS